MQRLDELGMTDVTIVDNNSTYPPLVEYLNQARYRVVRLRENMGHLAVWKCGLFDEILSSRPYVVTDCDVVPIEECPRDFLDYFHSILQARPQYTKVGFSLLIDDLPDHQPLKQKIIEWECPFWQNEIAPGMYEAGIDTTFALYRPARYPDAATYVNWMKAVRTGWPYAARHVPWYRDPSQIDEEDAFYQRSALPRSTHWGITDPVLLKEINNKLYVRLFELEEEVGKLKLELEAARQAAK